MPDAPDDFVDALLAPFPEPARSGINPRLDGSARSVFRQLRDARTEARRLERMANNDADTAASPAEHWRTVRLLGQRVLKEQGKDLEAAAWLTEALVRHSGLAGLAVGASLIAGLAGGFWADGLFPIDEDGIQTLVGPIAGLDGNSSSDGTLGQSLRMQVMFESTEHGSVTFWMYDLASQAEALSPAEKKQRLSADVPAFAALDRAARAAGASLRPLRDELDAALQAWNRMAAVLDEKAGRDAPSTARVRDLLTRFLAAVEQYAPPRDLAPPGAEISVVDEAGSAPARPADTGLAAAPVPTATRDTMLLRLAEIAAYFRRAEPQSPLSLTLEEAVRRARMDWRELLEDVVSSEDSRNAILAQLGIRPK